MTFRMCVTALLAAAMFAPLPARAADDPAAMAVIGSIPGPDGGWDYASIDPDNRRLFVAHGDAVMEVDLDSGKVNPRLAPGNRLHAVVPLPNGKVLATNGGDNTATIFEAASGKPIASVPTGTGPDAAIFDPATGTVLVMDGRGGDVTLIDPDTATSPGRIEIGGKLEFAAADGHGKAFVNVEDKNVIAVIDVAARTVLARYPTTGCEDPGGLAIDPASQLLVASCSNGHAIAVLAGDGKIVATLPIGKRPDAVMFDPRRKLFFVACGEGNVAVIAERDDAAPVVVATIPTAAGARTGAVDPVTGKLYLPTADSGEPAAGETRRPPLPGTFRILVVGEK
jgi:DNA-binding beta-propeller fold protein YncE